MNWKIHIHDLASKLNRANAVLAKLRHFANSEDLGIYFAIVHSHLNYVCIAWKLTRKSLFPQQKVSILQKTAIRIMNFAPFNAHTTPLFKNFLRQDLRAYIYRTAGVSFL